jgi:hypothetical protein
MDAVRHRATRVRLLRRAAAGAALCALALALALAVATVQAYAPPRGTPDLSKMTLQPSDLAPGAQPIVSSYFDTGTGDHLRAEYNRDWLATATKGGVKLEQLQTEITLADSTMWAQAIFGQVASIYGSSSGRSVLANMVNDASGSTVSLKNASFSKLRSIGVGQQSFYVSATITIKGSKLAAGFAWVRVEQGIAFLVVVAPKPPLADSVTIGLAKTVAAHIASVLHS